MPATMRRIVFARHGQCEMNLRQGAIVGGQSNASPLTPLGEAQAAALGRHLPRILAPHGAPAVVVASTAVRAADTARRALAAAPAGVAAGLEVEETDQLLELAQGEWVRVPRRCAAAGGWGRGRGQLSRLESLAC
jgi:broad specificity phosphatase PhoE